MERSDAICGCANCPARKKKNGGSEPTRPTRNFPTTARAPAARFRCWWSSRSRPDGFRRFDGLNTNVHIAPMTKPSNRDRILTEGLRVVHERGFEGASVRDIVQAAGVPQGSFTNHFASKEAFCLEVLDRYFNNTRDLIGRTLRNDSIAPLKRLRAYIDGTNEFLDRN